MPIVIKDLGTTRAAISDYCPRGLAGWGHRAGDIALGLPMDRVIVNGLREGLTRENFITQAPEPPVIPVGVGSPCPGGGGRGTASPAS